MMKVSSTYSIVAFKCLKCLLLAFTLWQIWKTNIRILQKKNNHNLIYYSEETDKMADFLLAFFFLSILKVIIITVINSVQFSILLILVNQSSIVYSVLWILRIRNQFNSRKGNKTTNKKPTKEVLYS